MSVRTTLSKLFGSFPKTRENARRFRADTKGGVAAVVAILSPVLIGAMGLGGEAGYWYLSKRKLQNAADVAAHASAIRLNDGETVPATQPIAEFVVGQADIDLTLTTVALNNPPSQGAFIEDGAAVEVVVTQTVPRLFSAIYDPDPITISARAVATAVGGGEGCVLALNETQDGALSFSGSAAITLLNCEAISNAAGESISSNGAASALIAGCTRSAGTTDLPAVTVLTCAGPVENTNPVGDPLSDLATPALTGACQDKNVGHPILPTIVTPTEAHASGMSAIRYCNGLTLTGNVVLNPGIYLIEGGDFKINAGAVIAGTGVIFYLADGVEIAWNGTAAIVLTAPTSGTYEDVLVFGDRAAGDESHVVNGAAGTVLDGTLYTPASDLQFSGNAGTSFTSCTQIIADEIEFTGTAVMALYCLFPPSRPITVAGAASVVE